MNMGISHFQAHSGMISMVEAWGFILGSLWGLLGIIYMKSVFITLMVVIAAQLVMMIVTLVKLEILMMPHWSYQIQRQESVLKYFMLS